MLSRLFDTILGFGAQKSCRAKGAAGYWLYSLFKAVGFVVVVRTGAIAIHHRTMNHKNTVVQPMPIQRRTQSRLEKVVGACLVFLKRRILILLGDFWGDRLSWVYSIRSVLVVLF